MFAPPARQRLLAGELLGQAVDQDEGETVDLAALVACANEERGKEQCQQTVCGYSAARRVAQ